MSLFGHPPEDIIAGCSFRRLIIIQRDTPFSGRPGRSRGRGSESNRVRSCGRDVLNAAGAAGTSEICPRRAGQGKPHVPSWWMRAAKGATASTIPTRGRVRISMTITSWIPGIRDTKSCSGRSMSGRLKRGGPVKKLYGAGKGRQHSCNAPGLSNNWRQDCEVASWVIHSSWFSLIPPPDCLHTTTSSAAVEESSGNNCQAFTCFRLHNVWSCFRLIKKILILFTAIRD